MTAIALVSEHTGEVSAWDDSQAQTAEAASALLLGGKSANLLSLSRHGFTGDTADADRDALLSGLVALEDSHGKARDAAFIAKCVAASVIVRQGPKDKRPGTMSTAEFAARMGYSSGMVSQWAIIGRAIVKGLVSTKLTSQDLTRIASKRMKDFRALVEAGGPVGEQRKAIAGLAVVAKESQDSHTAASKAKAVTGSTSEPTDGPVSSGAPVDSPSVPGEVPAPVAPRIPDVQVSAAEQVRRFVEYGQGVAKFAGTLTAEQRRNVLRVAVDVQLALEAAEQDEPTDATAE